MVAKGVGWHEEPRMVHGDGGRVSVSCCCWWWNIQWECASGSFPLFFPFRHLWLTVLFIGVPVVQGTHLQSFFLCTLSELRLGDKQEEEETGGGLSGREGERKRERRETEHWADIHEQLSSFVPERMEDLRVGQMVGKRGSLEMRKKPPTHLSRFLCV